ncbi:MAG TPA: META domain-containing protein [Acidimicrobiia bacterium]
MWRVALLTGLALTSTACLGSDFADSVEGSWQMTTGTVDGKEIPLLDSHPISITFQGDQVSGTASCNGYGGTYELDGSTITFSELAMTEMACSPEETMQAEAMFATALPRVDRVSLDGQLTLSGDDVEMVFEAIEPVPESGLTNTVWVLDGLIQGESVSSPVSGTRATIEFFSDGSALGDTGCRPFSGEYTISGAEVVMTDLAADGHECGPAVASQDSLFLTVIGDGFRVEIEQNRLTTWIPGDEGLTFIAES